MLTKIKVDFSFSKQSKFLGIVVSACVVITAIAIFQDYLHSKRYGHSFFFFESLLFKALWIYFPPILLLLKLGIERFQCKTIAQRCIAVGMATVVHIILVPITIWTLSAIFREQTYGIIKTLTFTLSNDLVKLVLVYGAFVILLRYLQSKQQKESAKEQESSIEQVRPKEQTSTNAQVSSPQFLIIASGKDNTRINLGDIITIKAATPYVDIQTENKQYLHSESLKSIIEKLDNRFIRVHKSYIVNLDKVNSYKSRLNGDYDLKLHNDTEVRLSRNYLSEFKKRYQ